MKPTCPSCGYSFDHDAPQGQLYTCKKCREFFRVGESPETPEESVESQREAEVSNNGPSKKGLISWGLIEGGFLFGSVRGSTLGACIFRRLAFFSWVIPLMLVPLLYGLVNSPLLTTRAPIVAIIAMVAPFVLAAGIAFGFVGCLGIRKHGARSTAVPGAVGIILNGIILSAILSAIVSDERHATKSSDEHIRSSGYALKLDIQGGLNNSSRESAIAQKKKPQHMPLEIKSVEVMPYRTPDFRHICAVKLVLRNTSRVSIHVTGTEINILSIRSEKRKEREISDKVLAFDIKGNKVFTLHEEIKTPAKILPHIDNKGNTGPFPDDWVITIPAYGEHEMKITLVDSWLEPDEIKTAEVQVVIETATETVSTNVFLVSFGNLSYVEEAASGMIQQ